MKVFSNKVLRDFLIMMILINLSALKVTALKQVNLGL